ncbi:hypothetical protein CMV30_18760 [Nibricoccus aquaticus]|uniref:Right handed beta helix domain-containing protein n=1 Tax=Nibricoccus aquaticus TaxID=2576891 RepID=A0A290QHP3_9BACT|nr:hypothetical protein CMV30_18760 [Nibricoccus aquaticus]
MAGSTRAANMTITQGLLDNRGSVIDFSQSTIGTGIHAITNTLQPGDTIYIQAHTRKMIRLKNLTQGTTANPIIITNTGGQLILTNTPNVAPDGQGIDLAGVRHAILRGTPSPGNYDYGIKVASTKSGYNGVKIGHNYATDPAAYVCSLDVEVTGLEIANTGFSGIQAKCEPTLDKLPAGYIMDNIRIHGNYIHDTTGEGLYLGWTSYPNHHDMSNVSVYDNLLVNTGWDAIQLNTCIIGGLIYNNVVLGYGLTSYTYSTTYPERYSWQNEGISIGGKSTVKIFNNWIQAGNAYSGSSVNIAMYGPTSIHNNVFILGAYGATVQEDAIYVNELASAPPLIGATLDILNNTIIQPDRNGLGLSANVTVPTRFINNIVAQPVNGTYVVNSSPTASLTQNNNLHVSTVAAAGFVDAANADYQLTGSSAAVDAGANLTSSGVTDDFEGAPRPLSAAFDIGAYEREYTPVTDILTPLAWGTATGSAYCPASTAFTAQPTWDAVNSRPTGDDPTPQSNTTTAYANRHWYVDFGPAYTSVRLTGTWTRYRPSSPGNHPGFASVWWDDDNDNVNDGINAAPLNFSTAQGLANVGTQQWVRDADFSAAPLTPAGRYLVFSTGPAPSNRPNEFAFSGYTVP